MQSKQYRSKLNFSTIELNKISAILDCEPKSIENSTTWALTNKEIKQQLFLTINSEVDLGGNQKGSLISVQTQHGYFELHDCNQFITFEPEEIIFLSNGKEHISCLVIGKSGTCSLFGKVNKGLIGTDIVKLDSAVLLAAMQLSLTESILA